VDLDNDDAADVTDPTPPGVPAGVETFTVNAAAGDDTLSGQAARALAPPSHLVSRSTGAPVTTPSLVDRATTP
jgi:hypothetical protein